MGSEQLRGFLTHLAVDRKVSAPSQNQALSAAACASKTTTVSRNTACETGGEHRSHFPTGALPLYLPESGRPPIQNRAGSSRPPRCRMARSLTRTAFDHGSPTARAECRIWFQHTKPQIPQTWPRQDDQRPHRWTVWRQPT